MTFLWPLKPQEIFSNNIPVNVQIYKSKSLYFCKVWTICHEWEQLEEMFYIIVWGKELGSQRTFMSVKENHQ